MKVKLKNEKSGRGEEGCTVDGLALGRVMETNHRGNSTNQQTISQPLQTHFAGDARARKRTRRNGASVLLSPEICTVN